MTASGTGIGLALVKELADLHGGDVTVESGRYGLVGASFTLTLPLGRTHLADDQLADALRTDASADAMTAELKKALGSDELKTAWAGTGLI